MLDPRQAPYFGGACPHKDAQEAIESERDREASAKPTKPWHQQMAARSSAVQKSSLLFLRGILALLQDGSCCLPLRSLLRATARGGRALSDLYVRLCPVDHLIEAELGPTAKRSLQSLVLLEAETPHMHLAKRGLPMLKAPHNREAPQRDGVLVLQVHDNHDHTAQDVLMGGLAERFGIILEDGELLFHLLHLTVDNLRGLDGHEFGVGLLGPPSDGHADRHGEGHARNALREEGPSHEEDLAGLTQCQLAQNPGRAQWNKAPQEVLGIHHVTNTAGHGFPKQLQQLQSQPLQTQAAPPAVPSSATTPRYSCRTPGQPAGAQARN
mmetsp:Transcript_104660/g.265678  ORF Transcript_104660/g.265678 Transcript_104660/m.265678 type:complete len:325 (+) Transcript_104660:53-1027(+)